MFKHKCELDPVIWDNENGYVRVPRGYVTYLSRELNPTLTMFDDKKIGLIKLNNIKHKFIKNE